MVLATALLGLLGPPVHAAAPKTDPAMVQALDRIGDGTWTQADLALIRQYPDIAAQVPDPSAPPEVLSTSSGGTGNSGGRTTSTIATAAVTCGWWVDVWFAKTSILGNTIYRWHHKVVYCRNGAKVTDWQSRSDYLTDQQNGVYMRDLKANYAYGLGTNNAVSFRQREIEYCILKIGCYENHYPWSQITIHGDGNYDFTGANN